MSRWPRLEWYLALGGVLFLTIGIVSRWDQIASSFTWSPATFAMATLVSFMGLLAVSASWSALHEEQARARAFRHFLIIQPAKHIPGGIAHPVGLISSSATEISVTQSTANFLRFSLFLLAGGLSLGMLLIENADTRMLGFGAIASAVAIALMALNRRFATRFETWMVRLLPARFDGAHSSSESGTPKLDLMKALAYAVLGIVGLSCGYAVLAASFEGMPRSSSLIGAFGVAWAVGYALIPFPAGLGVRESVLVVILAGVPGAVGPVLAAALLQRLAQLIAEGLGVLLGYVLAGSQRRTDADLGDQPGH